MTPTRGKNPVARETGSTWIGKEGGGSGWRGWKKVNKLERGGGGRGRGSEGGS